MAVIAAGELYDFVTPRVAAREADGGHGGLGARVAHAHLFDRGDEFNNEFRHFDLIGVGRAEAGAVFESRRNGRADVGIVMPMNGGAPGADEVDQVCTVGSVQVRAVGTLGEERRAAN